EALLGVVGSDSTSVPVGRRRRRAGRGRPRLGEESGRVGEALLELLHHSPVLAGTASAVV
ncbi:MAG TPA: hypothetical protein VFB34_12945, partial [Chloroflexota bacterium]|nr:hypothetical protein [Chloroflexota bacterium]